MPEPHHLVGRLPPAGAPHHDTANAVSGDPAYMPEHRDPVGRVPPRGEVGGAPANAVSGDPAYMPEHHDPVGRLPSAGASHVTTNAGSGDSAYKTVGHAPSRDIDVEPPPRRLRRLHRVWPDRDGNISYLLTLCVDGRARVLDNDATFQRLTVFLLDSPTRYRWFPRRFVVMPDHLHLIAHQGREAVRLGQWIKALKAVVGGLERREPCPMGAQKRPVGAPGLQDRAPAVVGRVPTPGDPIALPGVPTSSDADHPFTRLKRTWRWQEGFHDHKFRTPESEQRKWEYVCLNPVRYGLVERPEQWPFGGEIFYGEDGGPRVIPGTPPLLETGLLVEADEALGYRTQPPAEGSRPTT
ncbi:MAG: hypothetical protein HZA90_23680 [Verrucomicrobia bacterium]|nr:hypothetical protein [Verrucomicrobiota bacterium]